MSALSEKVREALYTALNVPAVVGASPLASAVYSQRPDDDAVFPFVLIQRQAPGRVPYAFSFSAIHEDDIWVIKAVSDESVSYPQTANENLLDLCRTAIGNALTLTGAETHAVYVLADIPPFTEDVPGGTIYHNGFQLRVVAK